MHPIKCDTKVLFILSLLLPAMTMASENMPQPSMAGPAEKIHIQVPDFLAALPEVTADAVEPGETMAFAAESINGMGASVATDQLETYRGGNAVSSSAVSTGLLQDASAINVATGTNTITDGAFAHASGLPIVIQNSGANVLIQNSTIVNVQFN